MKIPLVIVGSGGHARVILDAALSAGWTAAGFIDDIRKPGEDVNGVAVLGNDALLSNELFLASHVFIVAVGNNDKRTEISTRIARNGGTLATVIHASAIVSPTATIGTGTVLLARTVINANANVGNFCIVNTGAIIEHDVILEDSVQICPAVALAGAVRCEQSAFLGTGAVAIPNVVIGIRAIVGAGAVVTKNVPSHHVVVGNPAAAIRR
jgi:sugar O-acyltransferase (sialic acid O-acetyltransferase NeuD family)